MADYYAESNPDLPMAEPMVNRYKSTKRAERRAQAERAKRAVSRRFRWIDNDPRLIGIHAKSGRRCGSGCPCCAVPRPSRTTRESQALKYETRSY